MKRRNWIILGVVALVIVVGFFVVRAMGGNGEEAGLENIQTEKAGRGSLVATIGATGTVRANQSANLMWQTSGTVGAINTEIGSSVAAGDVLAELKLASLSQSVILAQADLVTAEDALEDLYDSYSDLAITQAAQAVAAAQTAKDSAARYLTNLSSPAKQTTIDQAEANVILLKDQLDQANEDFAPYANQSDDNLTKATLRSKLAQVQANYDNAVRQLNNLKGTAADFDIAEAQANLDLAEANYTDAVERYDELLAGPQEKDIAAAEARIAAAQATIDLGVVKAPFDGVVTRVDPKVGDQVNSSATAFRLDDLSRLLVDVQVSEVDINRIEVGQEVGLNFDAILAKEYQGLVTEVSLVGEAAQGVVNFTVTVELLDSDEAVRPGMTAGVNIVVSELEDVLLVPNRAVRVSDGKRVVFVLKLGQFEPIEVILGSSSDIYSEVVGGELEEGMNIVLNPPFYLTSNPFAGGPPGN